MFGWLARLYAGAPTAADEERYTRWFLVTFGLLLLVTAVAAIPFGFGDWRVMVRFIGIALLVASAGFASGALLGFLFGVPRAARAGEANAAASGGTAAQPASKLAANTNLEEVSDWLTKIVVGVTLVQFAKMNEALLDFGGEVSRAVPGVPNAGFAACLILCGAAVSGFMLAYLKSRTSLMRAFDALGAAKAQINTVGQSSFAAEARKIIQYPQIAPDPAAVTAAANMLAAIAPNPNDAETLRLIGFAQAILKNFSGAAKALAGASRLDPDPDLKVLAARAAAVGGDVAGANALLTAAPHATAPGPWSAADFEAELIDEPARSLRVATRAPTRRNVP